MVKKQIGHWVKNRVRKGHNLTNTIILRISTHSNQELWRSSDDFMCSHVRLRVCKPSWKSSSSNDPAGVDHCRLHLRINFMGSFNSSKGKVGVPLGEYPTYIPTYTTYIYIYGFYIYCFFLGQYGVLLGEQLLGEQYVPHLPVAYLEPVALLVANISGYDPPLVPNIEGTGTLGCIQPVLNDLRLSFTTITKQQ